MEKNCSRLCIMAFGLSVGIVWMATVVVMGLVVDISKGMHGILFVNLLKSVYPAYAPTLQGIIFGGVCAFLDAFISAVAIAWFYNIFVSNCKKCN